MSEATSTPTSNAAPGGEDDRFAPIDVAGGAVRIERLPAMARLVWRGGEDARQAASTGLELELPAEPCRSVGDGRRSAFWLGPDEWLLLVPMDERDALWSRLAVAADGIPHAVIDVSDRQVGFLISGALAAEVLGTGCPLDLDIRGFGVGTCTRTVYSKVEITLVREADTRFHVEIQRSYASYFHALLVSAARALIGG